MADERLHDVGLVQIRLTATSLMRVLLGCRSMTRPFDGSVALPQPNRARSLSHAHAAGKMGTERRVLDLAAMPSLLPPSKGPGCRKASVCLAPGRTEIGTKAAVRGLG